MRKTRKKWSVKIISLPLLEEALNLAERHGHTVERVDNIGTISQEQSILAGSLGAKKEVPIFLVISWRTMSAEEQTAEDKAITEARAKRSDA